jgi:hypothetical protein
MIARFLRLASPPPPSSRVDLLRVAPLAPLPEAMPTVRPGARCEVPHGVVACRRGSRGPQRHRFHCRSLEVAEVVVRVLSRRGWACTVLPELGR